MADIDHAPHDVLAQLAESEARMRAIVTPLAEVDLSLASALPGWSLAHLLTHFARNADSHVRRIEGARRGEVVDQYEGGAEGRERQIEEGATRDAASIVDDTIESSVRLDAAWWTVKGDEWLGQSRDAGGKIRRVRDLPARRLQEVEVHILDLDLGYDQREWSDLFLALFLEPMRTQVPYRVPDGQPVPAPEAFADVSPRDELAWLYCRRQLAGFPDLLALGETNSNAPRD
ncbi:MAG TPA: maleylpyruvate isomerase N-terminal domain-containing protein [Acidimicrobiia bacterium]|jgi:maleylpyruvate isomerase